MKPIQEYSTILSSPQLFFWSGYDSKVKYECSCSALVALAGLVFIDPLPLAPDALNALLSEVSLSPVAIILTSGNHQRWSIELSRLARIFHPSLLRKPGSPMDAALDLNFDQESMDSYSPDKNPSSALPHQPSRLSRHESDEISRLAEQFSLPIYAPVAAGEEIIASHFYEPGDNVLGLSSVALPGFGPGETAFWSEEGKILILGDALTNAGEDGLLVLPKKYCTDHRLAMKSLKSLAMLNPEILVTAHGFPITSHATARLHQVCALGK